MNNDTIKVILNDRGQGLTSTVQSDIHEQVVKGQRRNLVVFQSVDRVHSFVRTWHADFPFVPVPDYCTINNTLKIRGSQYQRIYVEDVHEYAEGIYDPRFNDVFISLFNNDEVEIVFTASRTEINSRSHSRTISRVDVMANAKKRLRWRQ